MTRRFLTSEDVRRARGSREIVVDEQTVVTPQALEEARAAGVEIRTAAGAYKEPAPDRGPDAERARRSLPNLPEPADEPASLTGLVVAVVGKNRPGVLMEVTGAVGKAGGNVQNVSQSMAGEYFQLILLVELPPGTAFKGVKDALQCLGGPDDYVVRVMHERVFRFMHRV